MKTMIEEQVKISVSIKQFSVLNKFQTTTTIATEYGDYQSVDDEVMEFVYGAFPNIPKECFNNISWNYI